MRSGIRVGNIVELYDRDRESSLFLATRESDGMIHLNGLSVMDDDKNIRLDKLESEQLAAGRVYEVSYETKLIASKLMDKDLSFGERSALYGELDRDVSFTKPVANFYDEKKQAKDMLAKGQEGKREPDTYKPFGGSKKTLQELISEALEEADRREQEETQESDAYKPFGGKPLREGIREALEEADRKEQEKADAVETQHPSRYEEALDHLPDFSKTVPDTEDSYGFGR